MPPTEPRGRSTRATPVALLIAAALLLGARVGVGVWQEFVPDARPELVAWVNPAEARRVAESSGRLLLLAFTDRSVPASRKLANEVFADPRAAREIENRFVPVRVDGKPDADTPEAHVLRERYQVTELPALVVSTPDGSRSRILSGYRDASALTESLTRASMEVMNLPFGPRRGFQFHMGGGRATFGNADSVAGDGSLEHGPR